MPGLATVVVVICLSIFTLTRFALAWSGGLQLVPLALWPEIFVKGLWFDAAVVSALVAWVFLYEAIVPERWRANRFHRIARGAWLWAVVCVFVVTAVGELAFWQEFSSRYNFIAVDYLIYTHEVIGNIRESYPVAWVLIAIAVVALAITAVALRAMATMGDAPRSTAQRVKYAAAALLLPTLFSFASVEQMHGSGNAYADELAGNGVFTFAAALRRNELDYEKFYVTIPQHAADSALDSLGVERPPLAGLHHVKNADVADDVIPFTRRPRNVVLISVESLSASFVDAYGADTHLTPNLDRLAREGLKFESVFATGTRTVRGLEALSVGTPPLPGQSIVRRPNNEHLATVGELVAKQGITPFFFYGGYGYFDNMNAFFGANGYRVVDRTDFAKGSVMFENIWGVADEALFDNVVMTLDEHSRTGKPFFAHVMTTSNHRPYTYPQGRIDIPSPGGRDGAVKYSDYAIGKFIEDARKKPWFADTLFVITADHCASVAGKTSLPLEKYRIPLVFYAPQLVAPGVYQPMVSQIDLAPTLIEVLGVEGDDNFFGRSFFEHGVPPQRAFVSNYQELGYYKNGTLTVLLPKSRVQSFSIDPKTYAATPAPIDPQLLNETIAYYQTASRAFKSGALKPIQYVRR